MFNALVKYIKNLIKKRLSGKLFIKLKWGAIEKVEWSKTVKLEKEARQPVNLEEHE